MKKATKERIQKHIEKGISETNKVWLETSYGTPESEICHSIINNFNALKALLEIIKTED